MPKSMQQNEKGGKVPENAAGVGLENPSGQSR